MARRLALSVGFTGNPEQNQELIKRIREGEFGEILSIRAYRMESIGPLKPKPAETTGTDTATPPADGPDEGGWTAP